MVTSSQGHDGILDTNTVLLGARIDPDLLPRRPAITAITLAELSIGPLLVGGDSREQARRQAQVQDAETTFVALPFDEAAARAFGGVAADLRAVGRKPSARGFDALIAAVAIARSLPLYTVNPRDFERITALELVPVPHPDSDSSPF